VAWKQLIDLMIDVRECNDEDLTCTIAALFPTCIDLSNIPLTSSDTHAIGYVLRHVNKKIEKISLAHCTLSSQSFANISSAIVSMPGKVSFLILLTRRSV